MRYKPRKNLRSYSFSPICGLLVLLAFCGSLRAQEYSQRGFIEASGAYYPEKATNDTAQAIGESLFRYEAFFKPSAKLQINGAIDLRSDTHHAVERDLRLSWWDRERRRPLAEIRRLSAVYHSGGVSVELGKQFVRWGKADILNPTDRFAPRDYLTVVDNDFLGITAARAIYEKGSETIDVVWSPRLTPSRIPLPDQRWTVPSPVVSTFPVQEITRYPGGSQSGVRWTHTGGVEFSGSYYEGFSHLPSFEPRLFRDVIQVDTFYPKLRMIGADSAVPLRWLTVKAETAYFSSPDPRVDKYAEYVLQIERQSGEWSFIGGYAGEVVTDRGELGSFAPDRGITKTFLGSAHYTIDANRNLAFETSIRQNLDGAWIRAEYSQGFGQHWRATVNFNWIGGEPSDFLGQYHRNSHAMLVLRYSF